MEREEEGERERERESEREGRGHHDGRFRPAPNSTTADMYIGTSYL